MYMYVLYVCFYVMPVLLEPDYCLLLTGCQAALYL